MNANELNTTESSLSEYGQTNDQPAALPLGVSGFDADGADALAGAIDEGGKGRAGQLLLALVVVVAIGGLFFMRTLAKVTLAATSQESESMVEEFLSGRDGDDGGTHSDLRIATIGVLTESYHDLQVPRDQIGKNPFIINAERDAPAVTFDATDPAAEAERLFNQRVAAAERRFEQAVSNLRLQSVLLGSNPVANISGNVVRTGDKVRQADTVFVVKKIAADEVTLEAREDALSIIRSYTVRIDRP